MTAHQQQDAEMLRLVRITKAIREITRTDFDRCGCLEFLPDERRQALYNDFRRDPMAHMTTWVPGTDDHNVDLWQLVCQRAVLRGDRHRYIKGDYYIFPYLVVLERETPITNVVEIDTSARRVRCHGFQPSNCEPGLPFVFQGKTVSTYWRPYDRIGYQSWAPENVTVGLPDDFKPWPAAPDVQMLDVSGVAGVVQAMSDAEKVKVATAAPQLNALAAKLLPNRPDMQAHALALSAGAATGRIIGADVELIIDTLRSTAASHAAARNNEMAQ